MLNPYDNPARWLAVAIAVVVIIDKLTRRFRAFRAASRDAEKKKKKKSTRSRPRRDSGGRQSSRRQ